MGLTQVTVALRAGAASRRKYEALFLVDTGATDCMAPARELRKIGVAKRGRKMYELANGSSVEYDVGFAELDLMGETIPVRVIFGPDDCEPILGVIALESMGIVVDPVTQTLKRLPALPLKQALPLETPPVAKGYQARHLRDTKPVPCPCGQSWRIFTRADASPANIHVTAIRDSRRHFHKNCTEFYYILEGHGTLEVGADALALTPGLLVRIDPGTPHRGHGDFKALIIGVPAWDPEDEWFTED